VNLDALIRVAGFGEFPEAGCEQSANDADGPACQKVTFSVYERRLLGGYRG